MATGSDSNGGGFKTGATGVDYSQQAAPQYALTGVTSAGAGNTVFTASAAADMVGNVGKLTSGTNGTVGWFECTAVSVGVSITFATNGAGTAICTGVLAAGVLNIGGALLTYAATAALMTTALMKAWIKGDGVSLITASLVPPAASAQVIECYTTTRGDAGRAIFRSNSTAFTMFNHNATISCTYLNFDIDGNNAATMVGIAAPNAGAWFINSRVRNCPSKGVTSGVTFGFIRGEVTNCSGTNAACEVTGVGSVYVDNWIHANTKSGIGGNFAVTAIGNRICNNTGATSDGFFNLAANSVVHENIIYGNGGDGIALSTTVSASRSDICNNIIAKNGGFGMLGISGGFPGENHNAYWSNTGGNSSNITLDPTSVILSADPFTGGAGNLTDGSTNDFTLNNTAGGGAACRAAGFQGAIVGIAGIGYKDIGTLQHQDPASSGAHYKPTLRTA